MNSDISFNKYLLEKALEFANNNIKIFPIPINSSKNSLSKDKIQLATTDKIQIKDWWEKDSNQMIGIATGNSYFFIDINIDNDKNINGNQLFINWCKKYKIPFKYEINQNGEEFYNIFGADILFINTPRGGKQLLFCQNNSDITKDIDINTVFNFLPGVNIYSKNHYTILPPSKNYNGFSYTWGGIRDLSKKINKDDFIYFINSINKEIQNKYNNKNFEIKGSNNIINISQINNKNIFLPPHWIIDGIIPSQGVGIAYGAKETYKTTLIENWGIKIAESRQYINKNYVIESFPIHGVPVYFISMKDYHAEYTKINDFIDLYNIDAKYFHFIQYKNPLYFLNENPERIVKELNFRSLIIIDNIPKNLINNLNDVIDKWKFIAKGLNSFVLFVITQDDNLQINNNFYDLIIKFESLNKEYYYTIEKSYSNLLGRKFKIYIHDEIVENDQITKQEVCNELLFNILMDRYEALDNDIKKVDTTIIKDDFSEICKEYDVQSSKQCFWNAVHFLEKSKIIKYSDDYIDILSTSNRIF